MTLSIPIQGFADLENVNAANMNLFYATMSTQLSTYFPIVSSDIPTFGGSICAGVGNITNNYNQVGTTNVFNFVNGVIRFVDQPTNLMTDRSSKPCYANLTGGSVTVTCPISATQYYVVAVLAFNPLTDAYTTSTSVTISPTAMTLAQINAATTPSLYAPLFAITNTAGSYSVSLDSHCAFNYGYLLNNPYPDITDIGGLVSIIGANGLYVSNGSIIGANGLYVSNGSTLVNSFTSVNTNSGISSAIHNTSTVVGLSSTNNSNSNQASLFVAGNSSGTSLVQMVAQLSGVTQYVLNVVGNARPQINTGGLGSVSGVPGINDIVVGQNLPTFPSLLNNTSGYQILPSGLYIIWGTVTLFSGNLNVTATLAISAPTAISTINANFVAGSTVQPLNAQILSNNQIVLVTNATLVTNVSIFFLVMGY